ncbi:hypothetical protein KJ980_06710 [Patescibacteria group bacterium]|nr:hypothetical protein [Patescibacteria group bacterium]MBU4099311.1 hypothetical protein [Patescibacteria group bacterium]
MEQQIIKCVFCKGKGKNLYFKGTCPVCKGKGKNQVAGKHMACDDCSGSGHKRGTTLTCYTCAGLGVLPDTREELRKAHQEIRKFQAEMDKERNEIAGKQPRVDYADTGRKRQMQELVIENIEEDLQKHQKSGGDRFCQNCAQSIDEYDLIKVCPECFGVIKRRSL